LRGISRLGRADFSGALLHRLPDMLPRHDEPIAAIATAPGRGAVGIVRVSGRGLGALVQVLCGRALRPREATYLPFCEADGTPIDHGLALFFPAPHSYTGEDVLELQVHGGPVVLQLLLARCLQAAAESEPATGAARLAGLRLAQPGEFTERAFLNDKLDLAQAEAVADLIDASTSAAARGAARSLGGAFSNEVHRLRDALVHLRMLVEATLDFPDEEIDFLRSSDAAGQLQNLQQQLAAVADQAQQGALLREGIKVVIAGQPNAGKSSLLNALAGAELAIVTAIAGTTRDKVQQTIQIEGVPLHIIDTAGLRESGDESSALALRAPGLSRRRRVLFLHDLTRSNAIEYIADDAVIASAMAKFKPKSVPLVDVWTKSDCVLTQPEDSVPRVGVTLSSRTGAGLPALRRELLAIAGWHAAPGGVFIARARHVQALQAVGGHLAVAADQLEGDSPALDLLAEELRLAQNALNQITGAFGADDLLGVIFSSFCIGK
jgi:tRNA modification GTPase